MTRVRLCLISQSLRSDAGSALAIVMFPLLVIAILATSLTAATRTDLLVTYTIDRTLARQLAIQSMMAQMTQKLLSPQSRVWPNLDGRVMTETFEGFDVKITISPEAGKININAIPNEFLRHLLILSCVDERDAKVLVEAIADYVDEDDISRAGGKESSSYANKGYPYSPRNGRMRTIDELRRVPGVTAEIFERLRPFVTTYAYHAAPDLTSADTIVRNAILNQRKPKGQQVNVLHPQDMPSPQPIANGKPFAGIVTFKGWTTHNGIDEPATEHTVYFTGNTERPFLILDRYQDIDTQPEQSCTP